MALAALALALLLGAGAERLLAKADPVPDVLPATITYLSGGKEVEVTGKLVFDQWPIVLVNGKKMKLKRVELVSLRNKHRAKYKCWMRRDMTSEAKLSSTGARKARDDGKFVICTRLKLLKCDFDFDKIPVTQEGGGTGSSPVVLRVEESPKIRTIAVKNIQKIDIHIIKWQDW